MPSSTPSQQEWRKQLAHAQQDLRRLSTAGTTTPNTALSVMRSSQADASRLDDELTLLLREQFMRIFSLFHPGTVGRLQPELTLLLDFLIFRYSVWEGRPLPGMALMNLRFRNERGILSSTSNSSNNNNSTSRGIAGGHSGVEGPGLTRTQRNLYCFGAVFLRYLWSRTGHAAAASHWGDAETDSWRNIAWHALRKTEATYRALSVLNFLAFLKTGRYRSILERVLRTRLVYAQPSAPRAISYEYLNRQLVWAEVSEVLLFLLPLVNAATVKRAVRSILPRLPAFPFTPTSQTAVDGVRGGSSGESISSSRDSTCGICGTSDMLVPYKAEPCGDVFCYYCLRGHTAVDPTFQCPVCLAKVDGMRPAYARLRPE